MSGGRGWRGLGGGRGRDGPEGRNRSVLRTVGVPNPCRRTLRVSPERLRNGFKTRDLGVPSFKTDCRKGRGTLRRLNKRNGD